MSRKKPPDPSDAPPFQLRSDRREVQRFLREQPTLPIPSRGSTATPAPGLIALELLGYRVIRRLD